MMKKIIVLAPHPDDETLGCGGTLLKHKAKGDSVHWLIVTGMHAAVGHTPEQKSKRAAEIEKVAKAYRFDSVHNLDLPTTRLDTLPLADIIGKIGAVFASVQPEVVYVPFSGDVHSDHVIVFEASAACTKWFRYPSIKRVLAYETLSETDFGIHPAHSGFRPNVFVDIASHLNTKIDIMKLYSGEMGVFPFPRSEEALKALATVRGAAMGSQAAEAFMLLREAI